MSEMSYRVAAQRIRDEIVAMLSPGEVIPLLEELVRQEPQTQASLQLTASQFS
jgi:hypothetical protein